MTNQIEVESGFLIRTNNTRRLLVLVSIPVIAYGIIFLGPTLSLLWEGITTGGGVLVGKLGEAAAAFAAFLMQGSTP